MISKLSVQHSTTSGQELPNPKRDQFRKWARHDGISIMPYKQTYMLTNK